MVETTELINQIKIRVGIAEDDVSADSIILSYLIEIQEKIKNYCNRRTIPSKLDFTVISMTVDLFNFKNPGNRLVMEEKQGNRTLKYAGKDDINTIVFSYAAELNRFRRVRAV